MNTDSLVVQVLDSLLSIKQKVLSSLMLFYMDGNLLGGINGPVLMKK